MKRTALPIRFARTFIAILFVVAFGCHARTFTVFDATAYAGRQADMTAAGLTPLPLIFEPQIDPQWVKAENRSKLPDKTSLTKTIRSMTTGSPIACLNVELWPLTPDMPPSSFGETISKLQTILQWSHEAAPDVKFGYYGVPPLSNYWGPILPDTAEGRWWVAGSEALAPLAAKADVIYPSLYTFYVDQAQWEVFATRQIAQARKYGKPVYVFLWPQYHNSNKLLGLTYLSRSYWRRELEVAYRYADGIVIWGGWNFTLNKPALWDADAEWWQETKAFMEKVKQEAATSPPNAPDLSTFPGK